jgi:hypothetical protein
MKTEEFEERVMDTLELLVIQLKELENIITNPDDSAQIAAIRQKIENVNSLPISDELLQRLDKIEKQLEKKPVPIIRQFRFLLFPESNQGQYYKIVFGRLIPWGIVFLAITYSFYLAKYGIEAWGNIRYNQQSEQCVKAWLYLNDHANKHVKKAMEEAFLKSSDNKKK